MATMEKVPEPPMATSFGSSSPSRPLHGARFVQYLSPVKPVRLGVKGVSGMLAWQDVWHVHMCGRGCEYIAIEGVP